VRQLEFITRVEPDEHRLVVTLDLIGRLIAEAAIERIAGLAGAARKLNFGSRLATRINPTSWSCSSSCTARLRNLNSQLGRPAT
jgi:hypothetical protein